MTWNDTIAFLSVVFLMPSVACSQSLAGQIDFDDFSADARLIDYEGFILPTLTNLPTPVQVEGDIYTTDGGMLRYNPRFGTRAGGNGFGLGNNTGLGYIDIVLGDAARKAGIYFGDEITWGGNVTFYDTNDNELGSVSGSKEGTCCNITGIFGGWDAGNGLIKRLRVNDTRNPARIIMIDNLITEFSIPEPAASVLCLFAVSTFCILRHRQFN